MKNIQLASLLEFMYPGLRPFRDYMVEQDADGNQHITMWVAEVPRPTDESLETSAASSEYEKWLLNQRAARVDLQTAAAINNQMNRYVPIDEQIGILRDQLVHILNFLGLEPTPDFAQLNEIAVKAVNDGAQKKAAL